MKSKKVQKKRSEDSKGWASYRVRGIKTSLATLKESHEFPKVVTIHLQKAFEEVERAVEILDAQKQILNILGGK